MKCEYCDSQKITRNGTKKSTGEQRWRCQGCGKTLYFDVVESNIEDVLKQNVALAKKVQKLTDNNRVERKSFREYARIENGIKKYNKELIKILKKYDLTKFTIKHDFDEKDKVGIVHISDTHFNELVDIQSNKYDFTIASQRLKNLANKSKKYFKAFNVKNVLIAFTGDLMNSDRRLDELLNMASNRAKATFLSVYLLEQFVIDLNSEFNIHIANVTGNESRVGQEIGWSEILASDNYDTTIYNTLKYAFRKSSVSFIDGDSLEKVVNFGGKNILLLHGHQIKGNTDKAIQQIQGKHAAKNIIIDFVLFGHIHSAQVSDFYARCASLVGGNDFSDKGLQLSSKASQNIHIINENSIDSIKVDLQETNSIEGYDIVSELEAYNSKSTDKLHTDKTVLKIIV